jgi:acetolactate synthase small subunit
MNSNSIIRARVRNEPDVLMRVVGTMRRRGFRLKKVLMEEGDMPEEAFLSITLADAEDDSKRAMTYLNRLVGFNALDY